ncbi:DUF2306 domain-containing protein [Phytomonospora endophytica]|uniref:DUF2306 domain-containing protein n=1 Tax=Phytomonospora endophytica TaxID=714109 RepID=A0A841FRB5_9ACTN|nr:DUF2306 domain-containing protein [Phytomonospora endophytica]MBB6036092.1 hypothetical protein [Phytomonospora endophytica]GIG66995.1 hypothetical protein Pen01_32900 [Phytomonospora endophytica]
MTTPRRRRPRWLLALSLATLALLTFMLWAYIPPDIDTSRADMHGDRLRYALLVAHMAFGTVATVAGLLQFWPVLRARHPRVHRWTGRAYFYLGIFPAGVLAVPVTIASEQGVSNQAALLTLTALWLATGVAGLRATLARRYADHRRWMIRNYALTLVILASRVWGGPLFAIVFALEDSRVYQGNTTAMIHDIASAGAWLSLLVNMLVAEWIIHRRRGRGSSSTPAAAIRVESPR